MQGYIQLAPDSTGKKVVMEQFTAPDGTTQYRQIAQIDGPVGEAIQALMFIELQNQSVLRAILAQLGGNPMDETYMGL